MPTYIHICAYIQFFSATFYQYLFDYVYTADIFFSFFAFPVYKNFYISEQKQIFYVLFVTPGGNTVLRQFQQLYL